MDTIPPIISYFLKKTGACLTLFLFILTTGCSPLRLVSSVTPSGADEVKRGVPYGVQSMQKLDLYLPVEPDEDSPVVVFFYGGSWRSGERGKYKFVAQSLTARGITTVIPDYRRYPEVRFPSFVEDGALALSWVMENVAAAENGIILLGHSAGAHLAALLALDPRYLDEQGLSEDSLKGVVGLAGPYGFDPLLYRKTRPIFSHLEDVEQSKPVTFACGSQTPFLLLHGKDDGLVIPENSRKLHALRQQCSLESHYIELDDVGHFDIILGLSDTFSNWAGVLEPITAFVKEVRLKDQ